MKSKAQNLTENQKVASTIPRITKNISTQRNADTLLGATTEESSKNVSPHSDSGFKRKKAVFGQA